MAEETTKKDNIDVNDPFSDKGMFNVDKGLGALMGAKGVKGVDTSNIDKAISGLEKPASGSVYDKLAARYRSQGAGAVLRTQKNLANLFLPTINLIQEREADALARYTLLKQGLEDFDDSTIFGQADGSEMPIVDEIKSLANMTKEDMRELSRLNPADERYDVLAKKIQKNNEAIAKFDEINQKLLEIRNSQDGSADASQWSKGMTQTEINMWMDIYTGKGNNIKIQDGKLVWTDTRANIGEGPKVIEDMMSSTELGKTTNVIEGLSEHFEGDGSGRYENLSEVHQAPESELNQSSIDGGYIYQSGTWDDGGTNWQDEQGNIVTQKEYDNLSSEEQKKYKQYRQAGASKDDVRLVNMNKQRFLINLGYLGKTNADGSSAIDGVFGENSKDAERRYLEDRAKLVEESKNKYSKTKEAAKTASGKTKVIDLNNISGGPTMIQNDATIVERKIQGGVQDLINSGVDIDDPNYQRTVKSMIYQLNQTGPAGIKSLIFDGLNTDDDDIFSSENTNSFIEGVIANNAEELGIKDPENMTEQELESAIEKLKEGGVTIQYDNGEGKKESLQKQFLSWYKGQIDAKVEAGVKSKFSTVTGKIKNKNTGTGGGSGTGKDTDSTDPGTPTDSSTDDLIIPDNIKIDENYSLNEDDYNLILNLFENDPGDLDGRDLGGYRFIKGGNIKGYTSQQLADANIQNDQMYVVTPQGFIPLNDEVLEEIFLKTKPSAALENKIRNQFRLNTVDDMKILKTFANFPALRTEILMWVGGGDPEKNPKTAEKKANIIKEYFKDAKYFDFNEDGIFIKESSFAMMKEFNTIMKQIQEREGAKLGY